MCCTHSVLWISSESVAAFSSKGQGRSQEFISGKETIFVKSNENLKVKRTLGWSKLLQCWFFSVTKSLPSKILIYDPQTIWLLALNNLKLCQCASVVAILKFCKIEGGGIRFTTASTPNFDQLTILIICTNFHACITKCS